MPEEKDIREAFGDYTKDILGVGAETKPEANGTEEERVQTQEVNAGTQATENVTTAANEQTTQSEQTAPQVPAQAAPQETDWFDVSKFVDRFGLKELGLTLESEEDIKNAISSLKEYEDRKGYIEEMENTFKDIQDNLSPLKVFKTKENYERYMMRSNMVQNAPESIVDAVLSTDMSKVDNLQAMFLEAIYRDPNLLSVASETDIKKGILSRMGIDISDPEFELDKYNELAKANPRALVDLSMGATQAKNYFNSLIEGAKKDIPEIKDFKQEFEQRAKERTELFQKRTNEWTTKAKEIAGQFKEFTIMDRDEQGKDVVDFTYKVPKEFQDRVANYLVDYAVQKNLEITPETVAGLQKEMTEAFEIEHRAEIRKAYKDEKIARYKDELDNKVHNNKPISTQEAPTGHADSYNTELDAQRKQFGLT